MNPRQFYKGKRVLVTGHTGFKGSWLVLLLQRLGASVCGYSLPPQDDSLYSSLSINKSFSKNIESRLGDIRDQDELDSFILKSQPDVIIHLAAQPLVIQSYKDPINTWTSNVIGSLNLLESCRKLTNQCSIVLITTDKVYKNREWVHGYREDDELGGNDPYSASKAAAEIAIESWRKSYCGNLEHQSLIFMWLQHVQGMSSVVEIGLKGE